MAAKTGKVEVKDGKVFVYGGMTIVNAEKLQEMFGNELEIKAKGDVAEIVPSAGIMPADLAFEIGDHFGHTISGLKGHHSRIAYGTR